jgi:hypothetical protein
MLKTQLVFGWWSSYSVRTSIAKGATFGFRKQSAPQAKLSAAIGILERGPQTRP